jgi:hypothetical protein
MNKRRKLKASRLGEKGKTKKQLAFKEFIFLFTRKTVLTCGIGEKRNLFLPDCVAFIFQCTVFHLLLCSLSKNRFDLDQGEKGERNHFFFSVCFTSHSQKNKCASQLSCANVHQHIHLP